MSLKLYSRLKQFETVLAYRRKGSEDQQSTKTGSKSPQTAPKLSKLLKGSSGG